LGAFLFVLYGIGRNPCDYFMEPSYDLLFGEFELPEMFSWLGSIATIIGFFLVQVKIDQLDKGWSHTILFLLSLVGEVYIIWLWNSRDI